MGLGIPVIVCGNRICDPCGVGVGVNDTDGRDVVQSTLVQQDVILQRVHADNKIGPEYGALEQLLLKTGHLLVFLVDNLGPTAAQNLLTVGDAARYPPLKQVVGFGELCSTDNGRILAVTGTHEQDEAAPS
jgi:hypothetical protein